MFPLYSDHLPTSVDDLAQMIEQSLRKIVDIGSNIVALRDKGFPELEEMRINLDGARMRSNAARPPAVSGETTPAFRIGNLELSAQGMSVDNMPLDLAIHAKNVQLHQGRDLAGKVVLVLHRADAGRIDVSAARADLEKIISSIAKAEAGKHGVGIEDLKLSLNSPRQRAIEGIVQFRARKLFLSGVIRIAGKLDLDEKLTATVSGLTCTGDGAVGTLACNFLRPHLQRLNGREFNLAALPLGDIGLHNIQIVAGEKLAIAAQFGQAT